VRKRFLLLLVPVLLASPAVAQAQTFGRMFPTLPAFSYTDQEAADLAAAMINKNPDPPGINSRTADDSQTLAAWQTYFGQFLDHNLDIDATPQPTAPVNVKKLVNYASGQFDMENVFGYGPVLNPDLYYADSPKDALRGRFKLKVDCRLGVPFDNGMPNVLQGNANGACDVARNSNGTMISPFENLSNIGLFSNLGSPTAQDDENQIISQMQVAWILFYNHFIDQGMNYTQARNLTVEYYKLAIFTQMLPDFVTDTSYINDYLTPAFGTASNGQYTINTPNLDGKFMPVEFSVGAYRFGHSLVRNVYHINDQDPQVGVGPYQVNVPIFDVNAFQIGDLSGGAPLEGPVQAAAGNCESTSPLQVGLLCEQPASHQIQWKDFFKTLNCGGAPAQALALSPWCYVNGQVIPFNPVTSDAARQTSPTISPNLYNLPAEAIPGCEDAATDPACTGSNSLIARDLARGQWDGLPSGQDVAAALGCPVIPAASINPTSDAVFDTGTPLEYYVEAEAKQASTVLGCVGSKIITQEFLRALTGPNNNRLTLINPDPSLTPVTAAGTFNFQDLLVDDGLAPPAS
jgi:hypothetical protein